MGANNEATSDLGRMRKRWVSSGRREEKNKRAKLTLRLLTPDIHEEVFLRFRKHGQ